MAPSTAANSAGIDYFNKKHPLMRLQGRISVQVRQKMLDSLPLTEGMRVLEVGATPDTDLLDSNFFSLQAKKLGCDVWVSSPEDCSSMANHNGLHWLPFQKLTEKNKRFDMVISSAVLEHLGEAAEKKLAHLSLLDALTDQYIFIATPNRAHWLEFHTKLPFIHWLPKSAHRQALILLRLSAWADPEHLDLLNRKEFQSLLQTAYPKHMIEYHDFRFLGAVSNLTALIRKNY